MVWPIVTLTAGKLYYILGAWVLATRLFVASGGQTAVNGAPISVPDFNTSGVYSRSVAIPVLFPFAGFVRGGTGSTTVKYPAACIRNPLYAVSKSSGSVVRLAFYNERNPTGVSVDVGLTKGCGDSFGSGSVLLIDNVATASGSRAFYTTGTQSITSDEYIKVTPSAALAAGYRARVIGIIEDHPGE